MVFREAGATPPDLLTTVLMLSGNEMAWYHPWGKGIMTGKYE